jgi:hypothetical protein
MRYGVIQVRGDPIQVRNERTGAASPNVPRQAFSEGCSALTSNSGLGSLGSLGSAGTRTRMGGRGVLALVMGIALAASLAVTVVAQTPPPSQSAPTSQTPLPATPAQQQPGDVDIDERVRKARELVQAFHERFKAALHASLKTDGIAGSVAPYQSFVAELLTTLSEESQFEIGRTSTRLRNPDNGSDAWELAGLERFAADIKAGADPMKLERFEVTRTREGQNLFRYMSPIMMRDSCLGCHGTEVKADVKSEISKIYSDDKALGYSLGDMRGAFTLVQQLD